MTSRTELEKAYAMVERDMRMRAEDSGAATIIAVFHATPFNSVRVEHRGAVSWSSSILQGLEDTERDQ